MNLKTAAFALMSAATLLGTVSSPPAAKASETFGSVQEVCQWFKQKAMATGDQTWWRKYYACQRGRW
jgi:hypothetical protein